MTISHKNLTGTQLHENKGVADATADQVATADGSGNTEWKKLTADNLTGTGNPFGANLLHVREEQAAGTSSTTPITAGSWQNHTLNTTKTNEISGASLASNQITLPSGTYFIEANVGYLITGAATQVYFKPRLQNITTGSTLLEGQTMLVGSVSTTNVSIQGIAKLNGRFTLAGTSVLNLQSYKTSAQVPSALSQGTEVYTDVLIWKVA